MRLQDFKRCLSTLSPSGTYLLWGAETFLIDAIITHLKDLMFGSGEDRATNCVVLYAADCQASDVTAAASTHPFLGEKSLVVVHNIQDFPKPDLDVIKKYLSVQTPAAVLVLTDTTSPHYPMRPHPDIPKGKARAIEVSSPGEWEFEKWVAFLLSKDKKRISPGAVENLRDNVGSNVTNLAMEVEKLICLAGDTEQINESHTEALLGRSRTRGRFDLADAVASGDRTKALTVFADLWRQGLSIPNMDSNKWMSILLGAVRSQLERIWRAKEMLEEGRPRQDVGKELKVPDRYVDGFIKTVNRFRVADLRRSLTLILNAELRARSEKLDERTIAELLLVALCRRSAAGSRRTP
jgi:DNA polymerase III delta subunit